MTKEKTREERYQEQVEKTRIGAWLLLIGFIMIAFIFVQNAFADTITHKFKSPSFSGIGTSSHY